MLSPKCCFVSCYYTIKKDPEIQGLGQQMAESLAVNREEYRLKLSALCVSESRKC